MNSDILGRYFNIFQLTNWFSNMIKTLVVILVGFYVMTDSNINYYGRLYNANMSRPRNWKRSYTKIKGKQK